MWINWSRQSKRCRKFREPDTASSKSDQLSSINYPEATSTECASGTELNTRKRVEEKNAANQVNIGNLPRDEREKLTDVLMEYEDVFSKSKMDIGCTQLIEHRVDTGDSPPMASAPRRVPVALEEKVDKMVEELLAHNIIRPSESP